MVVRLLFGFVVSVPMPKPEIQFAL
jgi:hypothetical protein